MYSEWEVFAMKFITVSELRARATGIVSEIETTGEEVVVTRKVSQWY